MDQKSRHDSRISDRAQSKPMTGKVFRAHLTVTELQVFKATPIEEECRVLDNFHVSRSAVDGRTGREFRSWRDASALSVGNNFGSYELRVPTYVVKLTETIRPNPGKAIDQFKRVRTNLPTRIHPLTVLLLNKKTKEVYEEVCSVFICGEPGYI